MRPLKRPGAHHERQPPFYARGLPRDKRNRPNGFARGRSQPPAASAQARPAVGRALPGEDVPLASSGQKRRWWPGLIMGGLFLWTLGGVDVGEAAQRARDGSVSGRECGGAGLHRAQRRPESPDARSCQHCSGIYGPWPRGSRRGGRSHHQVGHGLGLCRSNYPVERYDGSGVAPLATRTNRVSCGVWRSAVAVP